MSACLGMGIGMCGFPGTIIVGGEAVEPLIFLDFKNGAYTNDGVSVVIGDVLEENSDFGDFDPGTAIVPGTGLVSNGSAQPVFADGFGIDFINDGMTVVMTGYQGPELSFGGLLFSAADLPNFDHYMSGGVFDRKIEVNGDTQIRGETIAPEFVKIAASILGTTITVSVNGSDTISVQKTGAIFTHLALEVAGVTSPDEDRAIMETCGIYPLQDDADLPGLSAL